MKHIGHDQDGISSASTTFDEPHSLIIRGASIDQHSPWDEWAVDACDMLLRFGWKAKRLGGIVLVQHPITCQ